MQNNATSPEKHEQSNIASLVQASDEQLIKQTDDHSPRSRAAMNTLIGRHQHWILQRCINRLCNYHDAQDVTQDVLLRMYRGLSGFEGRAGFRNWLYTIVENQCRSFVAQQANRLMTKHMQTMIFLSEEARYPECAVPTEESELFSLILEKLPYLAREILQLRFIHDLSLEDIAQILCIGLSAAKMRLYRAIDLYRHYYTTLDRSPRCYAVA
jgi:RNA polymerase sigma-70 factor (ECF subfamily)